jgi:hypothetical protein
MQWLLEIALLVLLAATLFQAMRLERALGVLKRDRAALEDLVTGFNSSTRAAEQGVERLRGAAEGAGRHVQRQIETATGLKDDLLFLTERGEKLADRLDALVRAARPLVQDAPPEPPQWAPPPPAEEPEAAPRLRSQAERDLLRALRLAR